MQIEKTYASSYTKAKYQLKAVQTLQKRKEPYKTKWLTVSIQPNKEVHLHLLVEEKVSSSFSSSIHTKWRDDELLTTRNYEFSCLLSTEELSLLYDALYTGKQKDSLIGESLEEKSVTLQFSQKDYISKTPIVTLCLGGEKLENSHELQEFFMGILNEKRSMEQ